MDNAITLMTVLSWLGSLVSALLHGLFSAAQPTMDLLVPALVGYLVHRYVQNQTVASVLTDMAGTAYTHIGAQFASGTPITFSGARQVAIATAVTGMDDASKAALIKLSQQQIAAGVNSKLGQLLASDPSFNLTDPLGKNALKAVIAAAAPAPLPAPAPAILLTGGTAGGESSAGGGAAGAAPVPPGNFDITSLVQDAVRQGIEDAIQHGLVPK